MAKDVELELGWGRLIFGQTFADPGDAGRGAATGDAQAAATSASTRANPHVVVAGAPRELFIDPSHTYRLRFAGPRRGRAGAAPVGVTVRTLQRAAPTQM